VSRGKSRSTGRGGRRRPSATRHLEETLESTAAAIRRERAERTSEAGRRPSAAKRPAKRAPERKPSRSALDLYREAAGYGRTLRLGLLAGLLLFCVVDGQRLAGHRADDSLSAIGLGLVTAFFAVTVVKHWRAQFRVRREHPQAWKPSVRLLRGMLGAPFGAGDPRATAYDRAVIGLLAATAVALLVLSLAAGSK